MKRIVSFVVGLLIVFTCFAQQQTAKVTLKNGTSIVGYVKDFNPISHITMRVAGVEITIDMPDIESIEDTSISTSQNDESTGEKESIEDNYPETYTLSVGPYEITMRLIRGGTFNMGFDGHGSLAMNSEPVHPVTLNSFYINEKPVATDVIKYLWQDNKGLDDKSLYYCPRRREDACRVTELIAQTTGVAVSLISEAQWEFVATSGYGIFDGSFMEMNYCYDLYGDYNNPITTDIDPVGPKTGRYYSVRLVNDYYEDWSHARFSTKDHPSSNFSALRITFPANIIK